MGILSKLYQDKTKTGIVLGLIIGLLFMIIIWFYQSIKLQAKMSEVKLLLTIKPQILSTIAIACIILNTMIFAYANYIQQYKKAQGVFIATVILGILVFGIKVYIIKFQF